MSGEGKIDGASGARIKSQLQSIVNQLNSSSATKIKFQYEQAKGQYGLGSETVKKLRYEYIRQSNLLEYTRDIIENTNKMSLNKNILIRLRI